MHCPLKCFLEFSAASTAEDRTKVVNRYKKGITEPAKGMMVYYSPALSLMRGRLCPDGSPAEKMAALREKCFIAKWPDRLNDARAEANALVYRALISKFGDKKMTIFPNPRLQYSATSDVSVNLQVELHIEIDGVRSIWKLGMSKDCPDETTIRLILQMLAGAVRKKGIDVPISQIYFFDLRSGRIYVERQIDGALSKKLTPVAKALAKAWAA